MIISFMLIPITLGYLNTYEYGVWLTLSSFMQWIDFFDIGLGNGLRNKLSTSLAKNNIELSRIYISTTFIALTLIVFVVYSLFTIANIWIDWYHLLNISPEIISNLRAIVMIVMAMMCLNFVLKTIIYVYYAKQISMMNNLTTFLTQALSLLVIYILTQTTTGSLWKVSAIYSITPVLVLLIAYPITFHCKYKELAPRISYFKKKYLKDLIGLGLEFFFLKIGALLTFATSNIIISKTLSPEDVTPYNIALKYFSLITIIYSIILTPMWSAATEAYTKRDFLWLRKSANAMLKIWVLFSVVSIVMIVCAPVAYKIWIGDKVHIPILLTVSFSAYAIFINLSTCYSTFLFGIGKIRLQLISTFIPGILFVIIAPFTARLYGVTGVSICLALAAIPSMVLNPIQFHILLSPKKYNNIWYK